MQAIMLTAEASDAGKRMDRFLTEKLEEFSRSYLQKLLKEERVLMDGKAVKANCRVQGGEQFEVFLPEQQEPQILPENIPLDILYEDQDILVVNKPQNMVVHPAAGHYEHTLVNALMYHCRGSLSGINGILRPGIVHRIDKDTSGALVICKNDAAHRSPGRAAGCSQHYETLPGHCPGIFSGRLFYSRRRHWPSSHRP